MSIDIVLTTLIFLATIFGLFVFQARPAAIFGCAMMALLLTGVADQAQLIKSMSNSGLIALILLIIFSFALEKTYLLRVISTKIMVKDHSKSWLKLYSITAVSSAFLNNTTIVSTLIPAIRNNPHHLPSRLLLPLSYASILGGTLTLVGTSTNLIINSLYINSSGNSLGFFDFTPVGICLVFSCGLVLWFSYRFLPKNYAKKTAKSEYFIDAKLSPDSPMIDKSIEENGLRHLESLFLVELVRKERLINPVSPEERLQAGDRLIFCGDITKIMQITQFQGLSLFADTNGLLRSNLTEVLVRHGSSLIGRTLKNQNFRSTFGAAVVAIRRDGEQISGKLGDIRIKEGDFLVLAVSSDYKKNASLTKNFIQLSGLETETRIGRLASWLLVSGFAFAILLSAFGVVDLVTSLIVLIGVLFLTKTLTLDEVLRRFPFDIWLIVSTALLLSNVLISTGTMAFILEQAQINPSLSPYIVLMLLYGITWIMTELITNNASGALMFPVAWGMSTSLGFDPLPFVMTVAFAASASFISPYGYQTNLMVFNAGDYRFKHFFLVGLPVSIAYAVVTLLVVPYFFPF